ncbi:two-component system response regulator [Shewanella sp. Choline-02u-19]|uniref:response regulator n=1 Tax=unclassified Shewanella TaxID=196818 RepID=UPI000C31E05F|nr:MULTISPECIES: response regulator [unclassified Shewanella]PKG73754.1 two-component system response regulator [Shewanella sp. GutCb]PKH56322.1 two-component system response regulator [Shewanella sp. Bg11-22]PKI27584.1 two-component system response regulator [Shewanella sp. Choline-02u-19]
MNAKATIVIIEDESAIAENLIHVLEMDGFKVCWFATGEQGLAFLTENMVDLLVLDVGLPDVNGFELCKTIRDFSDLPIIFLTARNDEIDRVVGLEIGADDYVTKPFSPREMLARIKLRIKRAITHSIVVDNKKTIEHTLNGGLQPINFDYCVNGQMLGLTAVEFKILNKLMKDGGNILSREQLLVAADLAPSAAYERNIDSHIKAIRSKLKPFELSEFVKTKRGFGYFYSEKLV